MSFSRFIIAFFVIFVSSCTSTMKEKPIVEEDKQVNNQDTIIIDCNYTFEEAVKGTKAPDSVISQLDLITVKYYSMDGKIHQGQLLTNKQISAELLDVFDYILKLKFPVKRVIPVVKYNWNDDLSMQDNNSYSFCYRNVSFSKHAKGLAVDINPFQNPVRWRTDYSFRKDKPVGAIYNPDVPGTFYPENEVVLKFKEMGFRWGRTFRRNNDDHHFEK